MPRHIHVFEEVILDWKIVTFVDYCVREKLTITGSPCIMVVNEIIVKIVNLTTLACCLEVKWHIL